MSIRKKVLGFIDLVNERMILTGKTDCNIIETSNNNCQQYDIANLIVEFDSGCIICMDGEEFLNDKCLLKIITIDYIVEILMSDNMFEFILKGGQSITITWK